MSRLILEYDHLSLTDYDSLPITGGVYAMVFSPEGELAIDFDTPPYFLDDFDGDQGEFSIPLVHNSPRTRHYSLTISGSDIDIPDNEDGEQYTIEYWGKAITVAAPSRTNDKLLKVEKFSWHDSMRSVNRISLAQEEDIAERVGTTEWGEDVTENLASLPSEPASANYVCHAAFSYDSVANRIGILIWLERDGAVQLDALECSYELVDSTEVVVASGTGNVINARGEFQLQATPNPENIVPDEAYYAKITVLDADSVLHSSGAGVITWD